jgi:predicted Zn-dependent protease
MVKRGFTHLFLAWVFTALGSAQRNCPVAPAIQPLSSTEDIFSDQQEIDLGDAMAEAVTLHFNVLKDDELTVHLKQVGERLVQYLPPSKLNYRFYLVDLPEVNAFSIAGGSTLIRKTRPS